MSIAQGQLVLAITDPGLRSILSAQLGMAGETPISTTNHLSPTLSKTIRATALLIIEESLIASASPDWAETLRDQSWSGQIIIIVDKAADGHQPDDNIALVGRRDAGVAILALVRLWHLQHSEQLNSPE